MLIPLRQSTAITLPIGPFLDATDGVTEETGLAGNGTEIRKAGASFATGPVLGTHDAEGYYPVTLTTSHTDTLGAMRLKSHAAGHLPVWENFFVFPAAVYDSLFAGSDNLQVDLVQWIGTAPLALTSQRVQTQVGAMGANVLTAAAIAADAIGASELATDAVNEIVAAVWAAATRTLTSNANLNDPTAAAVAAAVWNALQSAHTTGGSFGEIATEIAAILADTDATIPAQIAALNNLSAAQVNSEVDTALADYDAPTKAELDSGLAALDTVIDRVEADTQDIQSRLPAALVGGRMDASVGAMASGVITAAAHAAGAIDAAALATDAVQEIADGLLDRASAVDGLTPRQLLASLLAAMAGQVSGAATTTVTITNPAGTQTRITATVDADGNRSSVTLGHTGV